MNDHTFVPADFDPSDFANIEPLLDELRDRYIASPGELDRWLADLSTLMESVYEYGSRANINNACHTDDEQIERVYLDFVENVQPKLKPAVFALQRKYMDCEHRRALTGERYDTLEREWDVDVSLFRQANVPLETQQTKGFNEYSKLCGAMVVEFEGQTLTLQQLGRYQEHTDRAKREAAWRLAAGRRLRDRATIDEIFQRLLDQRAQIAANAGFDNYRDFIWRRKYRFDYTPDDCVAYGDAVAEHVLPLLEKLDRQRAGALGVDTLRPWDIAVDVKGRDQLQPFDPADIAGWVADTRTVFDRISPALGEQFGSLKMGDNLDLESRPGKRPGGFQAALEKSRQPFIFMNAAGLQRDVETLLHEAGHAFHYIAATAEPVLFLRHAPLEFCEVASMSMELLGMDHFGVYYADDADASRAKRVQLEGSLRVLAWIAVIDGFQHWLYTHEGHSAEQRIAAWLDLHKRFESSVIDWSGLDDERAAMWHRQLHLFGAPFYYIEYGIAQLGAFGVWRNYRQDPKAALEALLGAFALGGTVTLPKLFETAGIPFRFDAATIAPLVEMVEGELATLPA